MSRIHSARKPKLLRAALPNHGIEVAYRRKIEAMTDQMIRSVEWWLHAVYNQNPPLLAQDESPVRAIMRRMRALIKRWQKQFDEAAPKLAAYFAQSVEKRSSVQLAKILRDGGFSVRFQPTPAVKEVMVATVQQNVSLIKSIAQEYLSDVAGATMRSVQTGRDLHQLTEDLQRIGGVTRKRAEFIALHQNNMASAVFTKVRQVEAAINKVQWCHSHAGKTPRPSHVKAGKDKVIYDPAIGWFDPHERKYILPGELIRCRCFGKPVIEGFS